VVGIIVIRISDCLLCVRYMPLRQRLGLFSCSVTVYHLDEALLELNKISFIFARGFMDLFRNILSFSRARLIFMNSWY
jgi:hypothetical protein